jgi:16S rRNA (cytidine1402-2'-O)-methyltransferase
VCSTPIGNLGDISRRLAETLSTVDIVYAEDTRRVAKLLNHLGVKVRTRSLFAGNEMERSGELVEELRSGLSVALVSDAGMPTISDPGSEAVRLARAAGMEVTAIPGPSSVTMSLALSGFSGERFVFEGFLPKRGQERHNRIAGAAREKRPVVWFMSPHRLIDDLRDILSVVGPQRPISINRELTKIHEEVWVGSIGEAVDFWGSQVARGEFTMVMGPAETVAIDLTTAVAEARLLVTSGTSLSEAARIVSENLGLSRRDIYQTLLED